MSLCSTVYSGDESNRRHSRCRFWRMRPVLFSTLFASRPSPLAPRRIGSSRFRRRLRRSGSVASSRSGLRCLLVAGGVAFALVLTAPGTAAAVAISFAKNPEFNVETKVSRAAIVVTPPASTRDGYKLRIWVRSHGQWTSLTSQAWATKVDGDVRWATASGSTPELVRIGLILRGRGLVATTATVRPRFAKSPPPAPGAVRALRVRPTGKSGQARITFRPPAKVPRAGVTLNYRYSVDGRFRGRLRSGATIRGLANGVDAKVAVWAVATSRGRPVARGARRTAAVSAFGQPILRLTSSERFWGFVTFSWQVTTFGRAVEVQVDSHDGQPSMLTRSTNGTVTVRGEDRSTISTTVVVRTLRRTWDPTVPLVSSTFRGVPLHGGYLPATHIGACGPDCLVLNLGLRGWAPGRQVTCTSNFGPSVTYTTDGAGDAFPQSIQWGPVEEAYRLLNDGNDIPADDLLGKITWGGYCDY